MKTFENQKTIVNNITITGRFYQVDEATFTLGCKALKPTTFLVWQAINLQYFTDKELGLSTSQICKLMGNIRKPTVQAAINELIEKGWMVCLGGNHYEVVSPCNEKCDTPDKVCNEKCDTPDKGCNEKRDRGCNEKRDTPVTKSVTERIIINNNKDNNNSLCNEKRDTPDEDYSCQNNNYEDALVVESTTSSCQINNTNTTYTTSTNITVDADANAAEENDKIVVKTTTTASSIGDAASEDAAASSGYDYIKQWESDANKYKDLLRPIQESGALKKFVKGTITPWHYDKSKTEQDYYDKLTALSLWNRVTHNSDFNMENDNNSKHPCFSLKRTYELWNQAEIFTPKD